MTHPRKTHDLNPGDKVRLVGEDWGDRRYRVVTVDQIKDGYLPWSNDQEVLSLTNYGGREYLGYEIEVVPEPKAHRALSFVTERTTFDGYRTAIGVNSGAGGVSLGLRPDHQLSGVSASLTAAEARRVGQDLIERADELDRAIDAERADTTKQ